MGQKGVLSYWLGLLNSWLVLDIALDLRHHLHAAVVEEAIQQGLYSVRVGPQIMMLTALAALVLGTMAVMVARLQGRTGALLAGLGGLSSVGLWVVEVISLHATDRILYYFAGPVMVIGYLWAISAGLTSVGILMVRRECCAHGESRLRRQ